MGSLRPLLPLAHWEPLVPVCTGQFNSAESISSLEVWWNEKNNEKKSVYFSSAEEKTVSSMEEEFVSLTSDEEIQNKKQDHLTQK